MPLDRRRLLVGSFVATAGLLGTRSAQAQLQLDITKGYVQPLPIAVVPFAGETPADVERGRDLADVIQNDLDGSGLFKTIDRQAYIQSPDELRAIPRFADWRQINAQALVAGAVRGAGTGTLTVDFRSWDVFAGRELAAVRFASADSAWRRIAHKIADAVYERLTGEKGYFDTRIAYVAETGPAVRRTKRLAIMDQDGANNAYLTDGHNLVLTPQIGPDARRIAYLAYRGGPPRIYLRDIDTGRDALLGDFSGMTFAPRFAPDGRTLLLTMPQGGNSIIVAFNTATRQVTRLTGGGAIDTSPSFAPDGQRIVFNSDRGGRPQLYVMSAAGGPAQRISFGDGRYGTPVWSPRGDLIAFTKIKGGLFSIGVMAPDGSNERLITRSYMDQSPSWAPNGRVVLFARTDKAAGGSRLFTIDITGYNERQVPTPTDASDPDWSPLLPG